MPYLLILFLLCWSSEDIRYQSDVKNVSIEAAKVSPQGLTVLVANRTDQSIALMRGLVCADREPGADVDAPGQGCAEVYFGTRFPQQGSAWSKPQCVDLNGKILTIRLIKIQTVE